LHEDALVGEDLFGASSNLDLAKKALFAGLLGLATVALGLGKAPFALLYAAHLGLTMVVVGTTRYVVDQRVVGRSSRLDGPVAASALLVLWFVFVFLPLLAAWTAQGPAGHIALVYAAVRGADAKVLALLAVLTARAVAEARRYVRHPDPPGATWSKPLLRRVISVAGFVFLGPSVCAFFIDLGSAEPVAVAATFALAEAYPFVATLLDRFIHREHRANRHGPRRGLLALLKGSPPGADGP
jgi:hypothetical protein